MCKVVKAGEGRETAIEIELKGVAVEKATNSGRRFLFFSRLRRSVVLPRKLPCYVLRRLGFPQVR